MNRNVVFSIVVALMLVALGLGIGVYAYNVGLAQGVVDSGRVMAPVAGSLPFVAGPWLFYGPWGFGSLILHCLLPLLFLLLIFSIVRGMFWRGSWRRAHWREGWDQAIPPVFDEWHRKAHSAGDPGSSPRGS